MEDVDDDDSWTVRDDMLLMNNVVPDDDDDDEGEVAQSDSPMVMGTAQQQVTDSSQRSVTATNTALVKVLPDTYQPPPYNQPQYPSPHTTATPTTYQYAQQATPYVPPPDSLWFIWCPSSWFCTVRCSSPWFCSLWCPAPWFCTVRCPSP